MKTRCLACVLLLALAVLPAAARADVVAFPGMGPEPAEETAAFDELYAGDFVDFDPAYAHALEGSVEAALWPYPGAAEPLGGLTQVDYSADVLSPCYVDSAGQFWGYARYIYGYRFVWICLSDPAGTSVEPDQAVIDRVETRVAELETAQRMQLILAAVLVAAVAAMTLLLILWLRRRMRQS